MAPPPYQVAVSGAMSAQIRDLYRTAWEQGRRLEFIGALSSLFTKLQADPLGFGEPSYHLKHLKLVNYAAVQPPLTVEYCVDEARKIVYIKRLTLRDPPVV